MSKVFICHTSVQKRQTSVLEITASQVKEVYTSIKARRPDISIGVYGARDIPTLLRTHRDLNITNVTKSVEEFLQLT